MKRVGGFLRKCLAMSRKEATHVPVRSAARVSHAERPRFEQCFLDPRFAFVAAESLRGGLSPDIASRILERLMSGQLTMPQAQALIRSGQW